MRWWLGLAFAAVAGLTAVAVVAVFSTRAEGAFRTYAREFAVGNAVGASESAKRAPSLEALRTTVALSAGRRGLALFAFDRSGRLLTAARSEAVAWPNVPGGVSALRTALRGGRYIEDVGRPGSPKLVVGIRVYGGRAYALVGYSQREEFQDQLGVVRGEFVRSALIAFVVGAALGLLVASLIARRLTRIARAASAIGAGDFDVRASDRFPDEVGSLAQSIEQMRGQLQQLFQQLEHDRDRLESVLDRLNDGVILVDRGLAIEFANGRARELLCPGSLREGCGRLDDSQAQLARFARDLFTAGRPGRIRVVDSARTLVLEGIPPVSGGDTAVIVLVDETEQERNERVQREFATNAAHELRTPLASIVTAVEMLRIGAKDEPDARDEFLDVIARESDRLTRLTRALLVLARAQARDETPRLQDVRVASLLDRVATSICPREGVEIAVECATTLGVATDPDLLEQALTSVATNSANQTASGSISFRGRRENGSVVIEVADTGSGIQRRDRARIFDRFYRGGGSEDGTGFGLGLSIARESVRALGGEIELDSEPSTGTTVRITVTPALAGGER